MDLTLKVKHCCIEMSLMTKRGLETLNRSWNRSQTSGEVQPPRDPKNFDKHNQRSSIPVSNCRYWRNVGCKLWTAVEIAEKRVEKSNLPATQKISTSTIKGQANDILCLWSPKNHHYRYSSMWNNCDSSVLSWLDAKIAQKNAQKPTWLARGLVTHFARQCTPAPGEGCDRLAK